MPFRLRRVTRLSFTIFFYNLYRHMTVGGYMYGRSVVAASAGQALCDCLYHLYNLYRHITVAAELDQLQDTHCLAALRTLRIDCSNQGQ